MRPFSPEALELARSRRATGPSRRASKRLVTIVVLSGALLLGLATPVVALG
ncbi:MAG: hypothetical protein WEB06_20490 [Actinomycetota bacterium]